MRFMSPTFAEENVDRFSSVSLAQPSNMAFMVVTFVVVNEVATPSRAAQPRNMLLMSVTFSVMKASPSASVFSLVQPLNM